MGLTEAMGGGVGGMPETLGKTAAIVGGVAAAFTLHESVESDEKAIVLNRGRVKLDREKLRQRFGTGSPRWARHIIENKRATSKNLDEDEADFARIYNSGGRFKFFSIRSIQKIKITSRINDLPAQTFDLKRGLWILDSKVTWKYGSHGQCAARAILRASSPEEVAQKVVASTSAAARESILEIDEEDSGSIFESNKVFAKIVEKVSEPLEERYGAVLEDYEISTFGPAPAERQRRIIFEGPDGEPIDPRELPHPALYSVTATAGA